jgi:hypothetical protein
MKNLVAALVIIVSSVAGAWAYGCCTGKSCCPGPCCHGSRHG